MRTLEPADVAELVEALREAASQRENIRVSGGRSKDAAGGPLQAADVEISTRRLNRVLAYEPDDLTISVEAGLPWTQFSTLLAERRQMAPLDPPFADRATIGGILAANSSGPRRRLYGTARDMIIGMRFATLEGKLVESGGMVVKNAAGLDLARLMIGSFGTLAVIVSANFRLHPIPRSWRTFLRSFEAPALAIAERNRILTSVLQPAALDLLNPAAAERLGEKGYLLALEAGGSETVLARYRRELAGWRELSEGEAHGFWGGVREFTPGFLADHGRGAVVRISTTLSGLGQALQYARVPVIARAASGVLWAHFEDFEDAQTFVRSAVAGGWPAVVEFASPAVKSAMQLWPAPGPDFALMQRLKDHFDPHHLLNRGRLYGRI